MGANRPLGQGRAAPRDVEHRASVATPPRGRFAAPSAGFFCALASLRKACDASSITAHSAPSQGAKSSRSNGSYLPSTYFHGGVIHTIAFSRPPGRRRRAGDVGTSSSGARARRRPRKATLRTSSRGPCDGLPSRRTTLRARENPQGRQMCHPPMKVSTGYFMPYYFVSRAAAWARP